MPTVLFLADAGSIHTVRWVNAIAERGWVVHLITLRPPTDQIDAKVTVHLAPIRSPWGYITNVWFVRRKLRELRPDLIHAHYASGYGTLAALAGGHPLIISVWGSDIYDFPEKSPLHSWLIRRNLRKADLVLSTSHAMANRTRDYAAGGVQVTPFGIDLHKFRPRPVDSMFGRDDIVVGTVKSLAPVYGIQYLIQAFALVKQRHPTLPLKLLLVGTGPEEYALRSSVAQLGLERDATFAGRVPYGRAPDYHNMLSISVSVSVQESFGVAVLEASACEKPVVVSDVGGLPEVVRDGVTGIIVPPRDVVRTADAIERLVLDSQLRLTMGKAGRRHVHESYDWDRSVTRMEKLYHSLLLKTLPAS